MSEPRQCRFCSHLAIAVFALPCGCWCFPDDREQALCEHHIRKASPLNGMILVQDLTLDREFTRWWGGTERNADLARKAAEGLG